MFKMKLLRKALPVTVLILLVMSLCACSGSVKSKKYELSETSLTSTKNSSYAKLKGFKAKQKTASSSMIELYFNSETGDVGVKNTATGKMWYALPDKYVKGCARVPSVISAQVVLNGQIIELNSCVDLKGKAKVTSEKIENGVKAVYTLEYAVDDSSNVSFNIPVEFTLVDGNFYAKVDCASIENNSTVDGAVLTKLRLLNNFGSSAQATDSEYILVPDNCGGIIHTSKATKKFGDVSLKIYGDEEGNNAIMGVFGIKRGSNAFVCIIRQGDAIATVNAGTSKSKAKYNMVGAEFDITESKTFDKKDKSYISVSGEAYSGNIELCYRFLSGDNASYSGMSVACREQLIRDGFLSSGEVDMTGDLPMVLSVLATANTQPSKQSVLTTYEQLQDMLIHLKNKGFSNIYVRYKAALSGGDNQSNISKAEFLASLGTQESYDELTEYMSAQNLSLFTDISCLTVPKSAAGVSKYASNVMGDNTRVAEENAFGVKNERETIGLSVVEENVISLIGFARDNGLEAVSVNDAASFLYSDYSEGATRAGMKETIAREIASISGTSRLMVEKGNLYALKNAEIISDMPLNTSVKNSSCYESVPFVQLVLHGTLDYSCEPINFSSDYRNAILRAVEYGALPSFEWCYEEVMTKAEEESSLAAAQEESTEKKSSESDSGTIDKTYSYNQWANVAYAYYEKANKALGDLRDQRMTAHYAVKKNFYCTEYGDTKIYVNYTSKDITVSGVTVPAKDFMRIN